MKLFALEEIKETEVDIEEHQEEGIDGLNIEETVDEYRNDFRVATESVNAAISNLSIVEQIKNSVESKKIASPEYFITIENVNLYLKSISSNLGLKTKIPSMEDFKNPYGTETCHQIVIEGFMDVVRSIWEKIKQFFKEFFNKIKLFFKRLVRADLDMHEYEEYLERVIGKVKLSKKDKIEGQLIDSKLPEYLADLDLNSINTNFMLQVGRQKLHNLTEICNYVNNHISKFVENVCKDIKDNYVEKIHGNQDYTESDLKILAENLTSYYRDILPVLLTERNIPVGFLEDVQSSLYIDKDFNQCSGLTEFRLEQTKLPNNFNICYFLYINRYDPNDPNSIEYINYVASYSEKNASVRNNILTIEDKNDLIKMYEFYKKYKKGFNVSAADKNISKLSNIIDAVIDKLEKTDKYVMSSINNTEHVDRAIYERVLKMFKDAVIAGHSQDEPTNLSDDIYQEGYQFGSDLIKRKERYSDKIISEKFEELVRTNPSFRERLGLPEMNDIQERYVLVKYTNKLLLNYLNSVQKLIGIISSELYGSYIKCKYELLKYIFKSADLYN